MGFWSAKSRSTSFPSSDSTEKTVDSEACNASLLPQVLPSEFSTSSSRHTTTTAVNRSINDVHTPTWVGLIVLNSSLRATVFHPLQLALARKRVVQESPSPSVFNLINAAYRGGVRVLPGMKSSIDFGPGGMRSLYRGYGAAFISSLIGESLYLVILESFKERVVTHISSSSNSSWTDAEGREDRDSVNANNEEALYLGHHWASASAAMFADLLTLFAVTPIAVVVGRQMTSGVGLASDNPYRTVFGTFRHLWHLHQPRAEKKWTALSSSSSCSVRSSIFRQDPSPLMTSSAGQGTGTPCYSTRKEIQMSNRIVDKSVVKRNVVRSFVDRHSSQVTRPFWQTVYGIRGLYQGTSAALLRIPSSGLWWGVYTVSKEKLYSLCGPTLQSWKDNGSSSSSLEWNQNWFLSPSDNPCLNASASAIASAVTTIAVNPIAVVQIRLQSVTKATTAATSSTNAIPSKQRSWLSRRKVPTTKHSFSGIAKDILRKEGIRGFFKGVTTNTCISVLDGIVFATMYELTKLGSDYNFLSAN